MRFQIFACVAIGAALLGSRSGLAQPAPTAASTVVEAQPLDALDLFSAAGRSTGMSATVWKGASADLARQVTKKLAAKPMEPGMSQLARDLLATGATAPDGASSDNDLAAGRVFALTRLGDLEAARAILARTPGLPGRPRLSQAAAELALWSGDVKRACSLGDSLAEGRDGAFWLQLRAFCLAQAGKTSEAQLALDLAAQSTSPTAGAPSIRDPATLRLLNAMFGASGTENQATATTALGFAISRSLKLDMAHAVLGAPAPALLVMASDETQSPEIRRLAALRLVRAGIEAVETIRAALLLPAPPAPPSAVKPAGRKTVRRTAATPGPEATADSLARLYAAARSAATPAERSTALLSFLRLDSEASLRTLSSVAAPEISLVGPEKLDAADRLLLATAASLVDAPSGSALRDSLKVDEPGAVSSVELGLLDAIRALSGTTSSATEVIDRLTDEGMRSNPANRGRWQAAATMLLSVADQRSVSPRARAQLAEFQPGAALHATGAILSEAAVDRQANGEAALLILDASASDALSAADRALFLRPLVRAGFAQPARSIALDGLLALMRR